MAGEGGSDFSQLGYLHHASNRLRWKRSSSTAFELREALPSSERKLILLCLAQCRA